MSIDDEDEQFLRAVGDVKRLSTNKVIVEHARISPAPAPAAPASGEIPVEFGEELRYLRPGIQTSALQKLRRGKFQIQDTLDLHGFTSENASTELRGFLQRAQVAGRNAVRIIHGKGYGSTGKQPVLKSKVNQWLKEANAVLAFCSARPENGGTGAVDVLLRTGK